MAKINNSWHEGKLAYRAYLLRCWQEEELQNGGELDISSNWRFSLLQTDGRTRVRGFTCLEELADYLRVQLNQAADSAENPMGKSVHQSKNLTDENS